MLTKEGSDFEMNSWLIFGDGSLEERKLKRFFKKKKVFEK